jgi:hypothetical protein
MPEGIAGNPKGWAPMRGLRARLKAELGHCQRSSLAEELLTPKQKFFIREYCRDLNASRAAIAAGYSEKGASVAGARLHPKARVDPGPSPPST